MNLTRGAITALLLITAFFLGAYLVDTGVMTMKSKHAIATKEPLLIEGESNKYFSLLPAGTVLYHDKSWPEGHETVHVYFHFKGNMAFDKADPNVIAPLWLRTVDRDELMKLLQEYPISKEELVQILKARKMTRADLADIAREWKD